MASLEPARFGVVANSGAGDGDGAGSGSSAMKMTNQSRQVSEFKDESGTFNSYLRKWPIEMDPNFNYLDCCDDSDEEEEVRNFPNLRDVIITHLQQVRQSFGFDVDCFVPYWAGVSYFPMNLSSPNSRDIWTKVAKAAIDGINADMNGKVYELVEVVKAVYCNNFSGNVTFTAKKVDVDAAVDDDTNSNSVVTIQAIVLQSPGLPFELKQWRFKP